MLTRVEWHLVVCKWFTGFAHNEPTRHGLRDSQANATKTGRSLFARQSSARITWAAMPQYKQLLE
jgi:hypothetical protein